MTYRGLTVSLTTEPSADVEGSKPQELVGTFMDPATIIMEKMPEGVIARRPGEGNVVIGPGDSDFAIFANALARINQMQGEATAAAPPGEVAQAA